MSHYHRLFALVAWLALLAATHVTPVSAASDQNLAPSGSPFPAVIPVTGSAIGAHSVRTADLDHDGDLDVIVAARGDGQIVWHENLGTQPPTFAPRSLAVAPGAYMAIPADLNRDGWLDIAIVSVGAVRPAVESANADPANADPASPGAVQATGRLLWLQNRLAQNQGFVPIAIGEGLNYPVAVVAADLNRDGFADLAVTTRDDGRVIWFENKGGGAAFTPQLAADNLSGSAGIDAGDIDGDGRIDLVATSEDTNQFVWLRNNGAPTPQFERRSISDGPPPPPDQDYAKAVSVADIDRDGDADVAYASEEQNRIGWFENTGRGGGFVERIIATDMLHAKSVYATDIDWDGDVDILAAASESGVVTLYENKRGAPPVFVTHVVYSGALGAHSVTAGDVDGDGDLDVLSASRDDNRVLLFPNLSSHRTALFDTEAQYVVSSYREPRMAAGADLDNDGDQDIISVSDDVVAWHRNDGGLPPNFTRFVVAQSLAGGRWIHAADIDADGDQDLFAADTQTNRVLWYENFLAGPGAMPSFAERLITNKTEGVRDVHSADLDGDGDLDLYTASGPGDAIHWFEQKRGASVSFVMRLVSDLPRYPRSAFAADLNLDGRLDLMSASVDDNLVAVYENSGGAPPGFAERPISGGMDGARHIYAGDLDSDGDVDIVAGAERSNTIAWYENRRGTPTGFVEHVVSNTAAGVHAIVTGDADRDGDLDIFAALEAGARVSWYENNGAPLPSFTEHVIAVNFRVAHSISLSDLDNDGDLDAIAASRDGGQVAWFENLGGQYTVIQSPPQSSSTATQVLLNLIFLNRGRAGDSAMRTNALTVRFTTADGRPLTPQEAGELFSGVAVYHDSNGSGLFDETQDTLLSSVDSLSLDGDGQILIPLPATEPGSYMGPGGGTRYFVTGRTLSNRCLSGNDVKVTHLANAMTIVNAQTNYRMTAENMRSIDVLGAPQGENQIRVMINEIMADNTRTFVDPDEPQEYPDWIELYNPSSAAVNLGGMFLTDDPGEAQLYRIPDGVTIGPKGYLVFVADGEPEQGPLHTNFRLSKGGESVTLIDKASRSFRLLDQVEYDGMDADVSFGRFPNGGSSWRILGAVTPGSYNLNRPFVVRAQVFAPIVANGTGCR